MKFFNFHLSVSGSRFPFSGFLNSPGRISIFSYLLLILLGSGILMLPACLKTGRLDFIDALFTAASAVCVTGLSTVDTAGTFTLAGRTVILVLIQVGGIGIMVLSTVFLLTLGRKVSMTGRILIRDTYSFSHGNRVQSLVWDIIKFTLVIEGIGALVLFFRFYPSQPMPAALYNCIFHSISAFCNAGFCLFSNSFTQYRADWIVNLDICLLIILGGIGFVVLTEIKEKISLKRRAWSFLSLHSKLVITSTLVLLVFSTLVILGLEWSNTLAGMPIHTRFLAALFQAVNARTAGFNSVNLGALSNETLFFTIILMFVGAAPGSCGGGVKVTTCSSIILLGFHRFLGRDRLQVFHRQISEESISKALSLILISFAVVTIGIIMIQQFEIGEISHQQSRGMFLEYMFEIVSAFGTVGLSTGVTPDLSWAGKCLVTAMMFIGRLGPLAIAVAVSRKGRPRHYSYATENIMIG